MAMDNETIAQRLKGFDAVWKRVGAAKNSAAAAAAGAGVKLMPGKDKKRPLRRGHR